MADRAAVITASGSHRSALVNWSIPALHAGAGAGAVVDGPESVDVPQPATTASAARAAAASVARRTDVSAEVFIRIS